MRKIINLKYIIIRFVNRWIVVLCITTFCVSGSYLLGKHFIKSNYSASAMILINNSKSNDDSYNVSEANLQLINTYKDIVAQPGFLDKVLNNVNERYGSKKKNWEKITTEKLSNHIVVKSDLNSQIITITVNTKNPDESVQLADNIVEELKIQTRTLMGDNDSIISISKGSLDSKGKTPNTGIMLIASFVLGISLSLIYVVVDDQFRNTLRFERLNTHLQNVYFLGTVGSDHL